MHDFPSLFVCMVFSFQCIQLIFSKFGPATPLNGRDSDALLLPNTSTVYFLRPDNVDFEKPAWWVDTIEYHCWLKPCLCHSACRSLLNPVTIIRLAPDQTPPPSPVHCSDRGILTPVSTMVLWRSKNPQNKKWETNLSHHLNILLQTYPWTRQSMMDYFGTGFLNFGTGFLSATK